MRLLPLSVISHHHARLHQKILAARVYDVAIESPLDVVSRLSQRLNNRVLLKREDLQPVFSFKLRGAYNKIVNLPREVLDKGIICASAGNHAQGWPWPPSGSVSKATVVMPRTTPAIKVQAVRDRGGKTVLFGDTYDEAYQHARQLEADKGLAFIHPYDDPDVIAGQGTIGMEILRQHPDPIDAIFIAVGGGGLITGVATYIKFLRPEIKIIGVEPDDAASMHEALKQTNGSCSTRLGFSPTAWRYGRWARNLPPGSGAGGRYHRRFHRRNLRRHQGISSTTPAPSPNRPARWARPGSRNTWHAPASPGPTSSPSTAAPTSTSTDCAMSPSGPNWASGARRCWRSPSRNSPVVSVNSAKSSASAITEFNYRYADDRQARVFAGVQLTEGQEEKQRIIDALSEQGYPVTDMSDNEMAKLHVRAHGRWPCTRHPRRIALPLPVSRATGRAAEVSDRHAHGWNISLFHYRNHGSDHGRVLVGIQVPETDRPKFQTFIRELGYPFHEETDNPAYRLFLETGTLRSTTGFQGQNERPLRRGHR